MSASKDITTPTNKKNTTNTTKKVVLAYSGGLDTSIIIPWLKERGWEVHCLAGDVGQGPDELVGLGEFLQAASMQSLVDALKAPLLVDETLTQAIVAALEGKTGERFEGEVERFLDWAVNDSGAADYALDLTGAGPWSKLKEPAKVAFPALRNVDIRVLGSLELEGAVWLRSSFVFG